jgi:protease-4
MDGKEFIENLEEFVEKSNISAIVVRIDSPGGVIAPSQEIFNALLKARKDKKIFASMGTVAASGGYYIAAASNTIVANPGTITGSIGVVMNLSNYEELQRWAKIKSYNIKSGKFKDMGSPTRMITEEERTIFQDMIDSMLGQFVDDIARGRGDKMEKEKIRKLADGRIFTGKDAQELGLVDELGGLNETIELAAKAVGIKGKPKLVYPKEKKKDFINYLLESMIQETLAQILHSQPFHPSATNPPAMGVFPYFYYLYGASTPSNL